MDDLQNIAGRLVDALVLPDGRPDLRPVHAIGIGATGFFTAAEVASRYCVAEHFRSEGDRIPVSVRFSNGSGSASEHDGWSDVRGMATRFHLPSGAATDLVAMTLPEFFTSTPEAFLDFAIAAKPAPVKVESPWRKILDMAQLMQPLPNPYPGQKASPVAGAIGYADRNARSQLAVMQAANIGAPVSYVRATYHAVHTFVIRAPDGARRWVRFAWRPVAGVLNADPKKPVDKYLKRDLRERIAREPARFTLMMTIAETGDDVNDSSRPWPLHRMRVVMGELTLDKVPEDQTTHCERLSFNPWLLVDGVEPSADPVLRARRDAYQISSKRRGGAACPFSGSSADGER
ncbi:MAG TPA: catalase [Roseiarcus sp.]